MDILTSAGISIFSIPALVAVTLIGVELGFILALAFRVRTRTAERAVGFGFGLALSLLTLYHIGSYGILEAWQTAGLALAAVGISGFFALTER